MYKSSRNNTKKAYVARPAGYSDSDSDASDCDFDTSGFGKPKKSKYVAIAPPQNGTEASNAEPNGLVHEDWEADTGAWQNPPAREEYWGETPSATVHYACIRGNLDKLKEQLSANPKFKIDAFFVDTNNTENPLITACMHGRFEIIKYLLTEKSAKPNVKDPSAKITPLIALAGCDNYNVDDETLIKCAEELVKAGADVNIQDRYGLTALMISVQRKRNNLVEYLLNNGAHPNITESEEGRSALFFAVKNGDGRMCRRLVEHGANVNLEDRHGWSVPEFAQDENYPQLASFLFLIRNTKWRPGCDPKLMEAYDYEAAAERKAQAEGTVSEDSTIQFLLQGVDGEKYIKDFRKHKISYVHFLNLDEEQLKEIGVDEVGVRERLLDNIQKLNNAQWQESSIRSIASNKNVTAAEAVCMIVNISQHLEHISSTLDYINKRIKKNPLALQYDKERNRIVDLMKFCKDAEGKARKAEQKFIELHQSIGDLQGYTELQVVGKIQKGSFLDQTKTVTKKSIFRWQYAENVLLGLTLVSAGLYFGVKYIKRPCN